MQHYELKSDYRPNGVQFLLTRLQPLAAEDGKAQLHWLRQTALWKQRNHRSSCLKIVPTGCYEKVNKAFSCCSCDYSRYWNITCISCQVPLTKSFKIITYISNVFNIFFCNFVVLIEQVPLNEESISRNEILLFYNLTR